jgi:purine-binding chemotaxis protein CheW
MRDESMNAREQLCTFYLDGQFFGLEVYKVQEVIRFLEMTRIPLASDVIRGLINLRGQIVTAIDLRRRLGLPPRSHSQPPMNVVVRTDDAVISLLVDEIGDVLEVDQADFEQPPETLQGMCRTLIKGAYKLDGRLLLVFDTEKLFNVSVFPKERHSNEREELVHA